MTSAATLVDADPRPESAHGAERRRYRCRYSKSGKIRFLGHRDVARCWERAIRRADIAIVYSEGFSPRPKLHFGLAISVGYESDAEYIDLDVLGSLDTDAGAASLTAGLPPGIDVTHMIEVGARATALQEVVSSSTWLVDVVDDGRGAVAAAIDDLRAAERRTIAVVRKSKPSEIDVVQQVRSVAIVETDTEAEPETIRVEVELSTDGRSLRIAEFLSSFTPPLEPRRVRRLEQWVQREGRRLTPLECDAPSPSPS